ncbi:Nuclear protein Ataxin-7 [Phaffia rhodozyma]|uniref:Nuclear protein Ataxin-7 n=1 Tax=Phaffia rhodozyma TaxID=264483 RepID=A0A0F7SIA7_PHARH|nr:Nuclear protein Ataxin-7 [Phaffia rhodozyma]
MPSSPGSPSSSSPQRPFTFSPSPDPDIPDSDLPAYSPAATQLDPKDWKIYGASPLNRPVPVVSCQDCLKPILRSAIADHHVICQKILKGLHHTIPKVERVEVELPSSDARKRRISELSQSPASSSYKKSRVEASSPAPSEAPSSTTTATTTKSSALDANGAPKKEKTKKQQEKERKEEKKAMAIDLSRHCGVINAKNLPCVRSLTCKSHSMGAKRDVPGRPKKYDVLLLEWNRAHNPKFVEPKSKLKKALAGIGESGPTGGSGSASGSGGGNGLSADGSSAGLDGSGSGNTNGKGGIDGQDGSKGSAGTSSGLKKKKKAKSSSGPAGSANAGLGGSSSKTSKKDGGQDDEEGEIGWSTELELLIRSAKTARANLSAPYRFTSLGISNPSSVQSTIAPSGHPQSDLVLPMTGVHDPSADPLLIQPSKPIPLAVPMSISSSSFGGRSPFIGLPREGMKTGLYSRRREEVKRLSGLLSLIG